MISSLIKSKPPDVEIIPVEGAKLKTWKMLLCLHSRWLAEILESKESSEDITSIHVAVGQDDLEMLLETIHYDLDVESVSIDNNEAAIILDMNNEQNIVNVEELDIKHESNYAEVTNEPEQITDNEHVNLEEDIGQVVTEGMNIMLIQNETENLHHSFGKVVDRDKSIFYPCDECEEIFKQEENLMKHKELHAQEKTKDEILKPTNTRLCTICNTIFQRPCHLRKHMETRHSRKADIEDFTIKCKRCDAIFQAYKDLKAHLHTHHKEESTKCNICGKLLFSKQGIHKHMQSHKPLPPAQKLHSQKFDISNTNLKLHLENFHIEEVQKCDIRDKVLINKEEFKKLEESQKLLLNPKPLSISQIFDKYKNKRN